MLWEIIIRNSHAIEFHRYDKKLSDARKLGQKAGYFIALANSLSFFMAFLVIAVVYWVGGVRYLAGKLTGPGAIIQVGCSCIFLA